MDLIPVAAAPAEEAGEARRLELSPAAQALAGIQTAPVERRRVDVEVRMAGKVVFDETRLAYLTTRVPGRVERLYANVTGTPVRKGEHLADLYSPELVAAQQELIQAAQAAGAGGGASGSLAAVAREKLRLWGLTPEQIAEIEGRRQLREHLTFYAPIGGVVIAKDILEGMYVDTGTRLYTVADLSQVWVKLDAYESDLAWLRYGQDVEFEVEAYPGRTFRGRIALIAPVLDPMTRTVKVRVNAANADGRLKPEMFVRAVARATVAESGVAAPPDLRGKWICPMHPDIVGDAPGACRFCEMPLVPAEELGYAEADAAAGRPPLVIPASAPLVTGKRALVYVALPGEPGAYEGREVVLGPRAGNDYVVRQGLEAGELVVVSGNFKIDSSLQIQGRASMMQPGDEPSGEQGKAARIGHGLPNP
jgi:Cu(I)/Ag(I) efflux system membrane fusion protein